MLLLHHGADVNCKDDVGWTPLHEATSEGNAIGVQMLLDSNSVIDCRDKDGIFIFSYFLF